MTVLDLINNTLTNLNAIAPGEPLAPEDTTLVLGYSNLFLESLNAHVKKSLAAAYDPSLYTFVPVSDFVNLTDAVTLPSGWARALMFNVAIDVAPAFGRTVTPELAALAAQSKAAILTPAASAA